MKSIGKFEASDDLATKSKLNEVIELKGEVDANDIKRTGYFIVYSGPTGDKANWPTTFTDYFVESVFSDSFKGGAGYQVATDLKALTTHKRVYSVDRHKGWTPWKVIGGS